jgi:CHASE3 domain sensor protein
MGSTFVDQSAIAQIMTNLETDAHEQAIQARLSAAEKGIAVWIVPSIGLYLLGMGVSWIRRAAGQ